MKLNPSNVYVSKALATPLFFLSFIAAYFQTIAGIIPAWFSEGFYSHSPLLVLIVGHLLWRDRDALLAKRTPTSNLALAGLLCSSLLWLLAWAANIKIMQIFAAYVVLLFGVCILSGKHSYRIVLPILFLLLFTLPIWQPVQFILQNMATSAVQMALNVIGVAVYVEGNLINIPNGMFEIEDGCSGVGYILVSLSLSGYLSLLDRLGPGLSVRFMLVSGIMALIANWTRILIIVLVGYYGGMDQTLVRDHVGFGWLVYFTIFLPYLYLATKYLKSGKASPPSHKPRGGRLTLTKFFLVLLLAVIFPIARFALDYSAENNPPAIVKLPSTAGEFGAHESSSTWNPDYPTANDTTLLTYTNNNQATLHTFVANYANQKQGSEVIFFRNILYDKNSKIRDRSTLDTGQLKPASVTELLLEKPDGTVRGIWYWYQIGGHTQTTELNAKLAQLQQKLLGRGDASIVAVSADCAGIKCIDARQNFLKLVEHL